MPGRPFCISNNPRVAASARSCTFIRGCAQDVLVATRDALHRGARLLSHPLYGNFRPTQHPYRSIVLESPDDARTDADSVLLLENALEIYRSCGDRAALPGGIHDGDRALVDAELIRGTLEQYGLWTGGRSPSGGTE